MYHIADLNDWAHHLHLPSHSFLDQSGKMLKSKTFWAVVMFMTIVITLSIVASFVFPGSVANMQSPYNPYYPLFP